MEKILVSACLAGEKTRYDGKDNASPELIDALAKYYDLVLCCPEVVGGLPTPREPSEIKYGVQVISKSGKDVTAVFVKGASEALRLCQFFGIRTAVLKEGSPSCGSNEIHNGNFDGRKIKGMGFTARKLIDAGIKVYNEENVSELLEGLAKRDQSRAERERIRLAREENAKKEAEEKKEERSSDRPLRKDDRPFRKERRFEKKDGQREFSSDRPRRNGKIEDKPFRERKFHKDGAEGKKSFGKKPFKGKPRFDSKPKKKDHE